MDGARAAYQRAIHSRHGEHSPWAALKLGVLLKEQGDVDGARVAFQQAIDSGNLEVERLARRLLEDW